MTKRIKIELFIFAAIIVLCNTHLFTSTFPENTALFPEKLFAGEWWIVIFPGIALAILVLAVNLLGDWMRDALNPKLR